MTIKEIAKKANVSLGTVDRVIHNRGKVSPDTKERILKILNEFNYKPNVFARGLVLNKSYTIAALVPHYDKGEYWEIPANGIRKAAESFGQFGLKVNFHFFDQSDVSSFIDNAHAVLESKPDGVILAPVINFEAVKLCSKLNQLEIPFTIIDSNITDSGALSFIGQDAKQSGKLAAKLISTTMGGEGKVLIILIKNNENHNRTLQERIEGFKSFLMQSKNFDKIVLEEISIDQRDQNWNKYLDNAFSRLKPEGIYVPSSKVYCVADILIGRSISVSLVGHDLIEYNVPHVASGVIDYVIGQRPEAQGYLALENFYKHLVTKLTLPKERYLPLDIITRENFKFYKSQIGI